MPTIGSQAASLAHGSPRWPPPAERAAVEAEAITTLAALQALRPAWEALWASDPFATPFQHPAWLLPWWQHVGRGTLASIAVRADDGELVGFAPLYIHADAGRRQLFPLGIATTDYLDLLVKSGWRDAVLQAVATQLATHSPQFDEAVFPQLRPGSPLRDLRCPAGWQQAVEAAEPHPVLDLRAPDAIPTSMAASARYGRRRAERSGTLRLDTAEAAEVPAVLEALARLHGARWSVRGEAGVLREGVLAAHRASAPQLHAAGLLRLHALWRNGEIVGVLYCLADAPQRGARRHYDYIGGFDPRCAAFSPGSVLIDYAIARARAEGAVAFDFLRGQEAYKYRWGAVDQDMATLRFWRGSC